MAALEEQVIEPVRAVQKLIDGSEYVTRLYSTLSAAEMTHDPLFGFNADLPDVANVHTAERVILCSKSVSESEAPWRVTFPQGGTIYGTAQQANRAIWPGAVDEQPPNAVVLQLSESGPGAVLLDNRPRIDESLAATRSNAKVPDADDGCSFRAANGAPSFALLTLLGAAVARFSARRYFASKRRRPSA
jgi:hypothetical protein